MDSKGQQHQRQYHVDKANRRESTIVSIELETISIDVVNAARSHVSRRDDTAATASAKPFGRRVYTSYVVNYKYIARQQYNVVIN